MIVRVPPRDCFWCASVDLSGSDVESTPGAVRTRVDAFDDLPAGALTLVYVALHNYEAASLEFLLGLEILPLNMLVSMRTTKAEVWPSDALSALDRALARGYRARWIPPHWLANSERRPKVSLPNTLMFFYL